MKKRVDFFFDLSSPYSYMAATQLPDICKRNDAELVWRPMVLFAVFKATGNDMPARVNAKARFMGQDLERWAKHYGVPYKWSSHFPVNAIKPMRLILVDEGKSQAVAQAAFHAMWADDRNIADDGVIRDLARAAGFDVDAAMAAIESPAVKDKLRANTDEAIAKGAFGAPTIIVGDELFWGNDRLHFVEAALRK
jgi:2-hydroxychromene-2-carboxylate isomerase